MVSVDLNIEASWLTTRCTRRPHLQSSAAAGERETLVEKPVTKVPETVLLSELALAEDWNRPEEDIALSHLQPVS